MRACKCMVLSAEALAYVNVCMYTYTVADVCSAVHMHANTPQKPLHPFMCVFKCMVLYAEALASVNVYMQTYKVAGLCSEVHMHAGA